MRTITSAFLSTLAVTLLLACGHERGPEPEGTVAFPPMTQVGEDTYAAGGTLTMQATVADIDQADRFIVLRGEGGDEVGFRVGPEVRNLAQVRKGDVVTVAYHASVAVQLHKPGEATPGVEGAEGVARAKPGEMPGAAGVRSVSVTATIQKIDRERQVVQLRGPEGRVVEVLVRNPERLEGVKKGDLVEITYTEALAVGVEKVR